VAFFNRTNRHSWRTILLGTFAVTAILSSVGQEANAKYVRICNHPDPGKWGFGSAPVGCDADVFGDTSRIAKVYPQFIFKMSLLDDTNQRIQYVTNIYSLIKQMAADFYVKVKPAASKAEIEGWVHAILAISTHESYMTHYRIALDGRYKLMTGDQVRSQGLMQVDQQFFANRGRDPSLDLAGNINAAMEVYYTHWVDAVDSSCYKSALRTGRSSLAQLLEDRARGAYSAYNGGDSKICRYVNTRDPYHHTDVHYAQAYETQEWLQYVQDPNRKISLNTECILNGDDLCGVADESQAEIASQMPWGPDGGGNPVVPVDPPPAPLAPPPAQPVQPQEGGASLIGHPLVFDNGMTCLTKDGTNLDCAPNLKTFSCLVKYTPQVLDAQPIHLRDFTAKMKINTLEDRDLLCRGVVHDLAVVGDYISFTKSVRIADEEEHGQEVGMVTAGVVVQVIDYDVRLSEEGDRYYKVQAQDGISGWIYAGNDQTEASFGLHIENAPVMVGPQAVPVVGQMIEIVHAGGEQLKSEASATKGKVLEILSTGRKFKVEKVDNWGPNNELYLKVTLAGVSGYVYAGHTYPTNTIGSWVKVVQ
jgi:hypothetical protein